MEDKKGTSEEPEKVDSVEEKPTDDKPTSEDKPAEDIAAEDKKTEDKDAEKVKAEEGITEEAIEDALPEPPQTDEYKLDIEEQKSKKSIMPVIVALVVVVAAAVAWVLLSKSDSTEDTTTETDTQEVASFAQGAAVTYIDGDVEYYYGLAWTDVAPGQNLREADQIRTGDDSKAIITLDDGSALRLSSNSQVTLTKLSTDSVVIENAGGEVYSRVSSSETRTFEVLVGEDSFTALGTAYRTTNETDEKGVEVFQSEVKVDEETTVKEGEEYYSENKDTKKEGKVSEIDLDKLADDEFVSWNKDQDEKQKEYQDKLGVLKDLKNEEEKDEEPKPEPTPSTPSAKITASAIQKDNGVKVSWTNSGIDASSGYKVAFSKTDTTPTYGENSAKYVSKDASSILLELQDDKTWYIRVCTYRPDSSTKCTNYSNVVTIKAPLVEKDKVESGAPISVILEGNTLSWTYTGEASYGFKVIWNTEGSPSYYNKLGKVGVSSGPVNLSEKIEDPGTYYVVVCKYALHPEEAPCVDYSDNVEYTKVAE